MVVCTENAVKSDSVRYEVQTFASLGRKIVPIDVNDSFCSWKANRDLWRLIGGEAPESESPDALTAGAPSDNVAERVVKAIEFTIQEQRLRRAVGVTVSLIALAIVAVFGAYRSVSQANAKVSGALLEQRKAEHETKKQTKETARQQKLAGEARAEATRMTAEADKQREAASSLQLATASAYALPIDPIVALHDAIAASRKKKSLESSIALSNALAEQRVRFILKHPKYVSCAHFSPIRAQVATCSSEGVRLWSLDGNKPRPILMRALGNLTYSPSGESILTWGASGLALWDAKKGTLVHILTDTRLPSGPAVFTNDGHYVIAMCANLRIGLWDTATGKLSKAFGDRPGLIQFISLSPDASRLLTADWRYVSVWNMSDYSLAYRFDPTSNINSIINQAELVGGSRLLTIVGRELQVRNAESGQEIYTLEDIGHVEASNHGNYLLSTGSGGISIWDGKSRRQILSPSDGGAIMAAHFSPDDKKIIVADNNHTASVWDAETGNRLYTLMGHHSGIQEAMFSSDQRFVLTVGAFDREVRIWDTECPLALHIFHDAAGPLNHIAYSSDGLKLLCMPWDGRPNVWNIRIGRKGRACAATRSSDRRRLFPGPVKALRDKRRQHLSSVAVRRQTDASFRGGDRSD